MRFENSTLFIHVIIKYTLVIIISINIKYYQLSTQSTKIVRERSTIIIKQQEYYKVSKYFNHIKFVYIYRIVERSVITLVYKKKLGKKFHYTTNHTLY